MKTIAITIDDETLAELDRAARTAGAARVNRSRLVRVALREYLQGAARAADEAREREIVRTHRGRLRRQGAALVKEQARP